jgi:hypothetical protein
LGAEPDGVSTGADHAGDQQGLESDAGWLLDTAVWSVMVTSM